MRAYESIPFDDPSVDALSDVARAEIADHWRRRAKSELQVGRAFAAMAPLLRERRASATVVDRLVSGAAEEERHAAICVRLAEAYAGESVRAPEVLGVTLPRFDVGDEELEIALLVAGMCCVNETIATAWLGVCLAASTAPLAVAANRVHLRDEIGHARLGWAHLASDAVSSSTRAALAECLPPLLAANVPHWEREDLLVAADGARPHGHPGPAESRAAALDALRELVLPGFAHVGIDIRPAQGWLDQHVRR